MSTFYCFWTSVNSLVLHISRCKQPFVSWLLDNLNLFRNSKRRIFTRWWTTRREGPLCEHYVSSMWTLCEHVTNIMRIKNKPITKQSFGGSLVVCRSRLVGPYIRCILQVKLQYVSSYVNIPELYTLIYQVFIKDNCSAYNTFQSINVVLLCQTLAIFNSIESLCCLIAKPYMKLSSNISSFNV